MPQVCGTAWLMNWGRQTVLIFLKGDSRLHFLIWLLIYLVMNLISLWVIYVYLFVLLSLVGILFNFYILSYLEMLLSFRTYCGSIVPSFVKKTPTCVNSFTWLHTQLQTDPVSNEGHRPKVPIRTTSSANSPPNCKSSYPSWLHLETLYMKITNRIVTKRSPGRDQPSEQFWLTVENLNTASAFEVKRLDE